MKIEIRYDENRTECDYVKELVAIDIHCSTREELVKAQHIINGVLAVLPANKPGEAP